MQLTGRNTAVQADMNFTENRELSWLKFNERVLSEASDPSVPLLERYKFISIFTSNLDEFFMIRVGSLYDLSLVDEAHTDNKSGMTAKEQIAEVLRRCVPLYGERDRCLAALEAELRLRDIFRLDFAELESTEKKYIYERFRSFILPVLSPLIVDTHHPFPHLENKSLNIVALLKSKDDIRLGIINVPKSLPRLFFLPGGNIRYILLEDIILEYCERIFEKHTVLNKSVASITRNADINPDDEALDFEEDFRIHMKKLLKRRSRLAAVRLEIQGGADAAVTDYLCAKLHIGRDNVFECSAPLDLSYYFLLEEKIPPIMKRMLLYTPFEPQYPAGLRKTEGIIKRVAQKDILLSYPYESMEPLLRLVREAASDPEVISIKITLYRIDKTSRFAEFLISAAENGKDVTVVMELRARFDEQNNINWAERLEEAGCKVIYGFEGFKVHSKICLITCYAKNKLRHITHLGTGNYNEKTAKLYTDLALITANEEIGNDAVAFFKNIAISNADGQYGQLLVAPSSLKRSLIALINGEIDKAEDGRAAEIVFKLNSLSDRNIIDKLAQASCAGVHIELIVRGICCILPGVPGKTENIRVTSIVGRFLEHYRVYCFGSGSEARMYLSSADIMTRNTERRIEIAFPVLDGDIKARIRDMLETQLADNTKAWALGASGMYSKKIPNGNRRINSHEYFMDEAMKKAETNTVQTTLFFKKLGAFFGRLRD